MRFNFWHKRDAATTDKTELAQSDKAGLKPLPVEFHEPSMDQVLTGDNPTSGGGSSGGYGSFQPFKDPKDPREPMPTIGTRRPHLER